MSKTYELSYTAERIDEMLKEVDEHTIYSDATTEEHGLMSTTDKTKLDALPTAQQIEGSLSEKVDKVSEATSGNFAGLDSNGNLTDSGKKASDFATEVDLAELGAYVTNNKQDKLTFDSTPTQNSTNPVTSDGVFGALIGKQDVLDFDSTPTENSTNPVVSDGIYRALKRKENTLTFDTTPTSRSVNPVTSDGIYEALMVKADKSDTYTKSEVDSMVSSAYKAAGSAATVSQLGELTSANLGKVYNMTAAFETTAYFVEGAGKSYPEGTNVAIVSPSSGVYKYDVLAGFVDLSGKADKVNNATSGNFAGLDANGNLTDSGKKASDFNTPVETSLPATGGILPNTIYKLGTLANDASITIILETPTDNTIANVYTVTFDTGNFDGRGPSIIWGLPITYHWADGEAPSIEPNTCYEVSIMDNIAVCVTVEKVHNLPVEPSVEP